MPKIKNHETKASELRKSATQKERDALKSTNKADYILTNLDENKAKQFESIEKAEVFKPQLIETSLIANNENSAQKIVDSNENNKIKDVLKNNTSDTNENTTNLNNENTDNNVNNENKDINNTVIENNEKLNAENINNNNTNNNVNNVTSDNSNNFTAPTEIDNVPDVLTQSIFNFSKTNATPYNNSNPIPKIEKMPQGLIFMVQIGAFRNAIPQDHFKGFSPIKAEDAGNGITRYTAGLFKTFDVADIAKTEIRSIGYSDAFVVAFYNGKRININKAKEMLGNASNNIQYK